MEDVMFRAAWKGKKTQLRVTQEDEELKGYVGDTHVLTLAFDEDDVIVEEYCDEDLVYDEDALVEALEVALDSDEEESDEEESDEEESDEEESDDEEPEVDEDEDADYGEPVEPAGISGVPTLHAVLVAYGAGIDVDGDVRTTRDFFRKLQGFGIVNVQETLLTGADATGKNTLAAIEAIEAGEDDVVWFAYLGHGAMEEGDRLLVTHGKMLRRGAVADAVRATRARLRIVLSDCCANEIGRVEPDEKMGASGPGPDSSERLRTLFTRYSGTFDASSSADHQYSFAGVFTPCLINKVLLKRTPETWGAVFDETQKASMAASADGAMSEDGRRALKREGREIVDAQQPVSFSLPTLME